MGPERRAFHPSDPTGVGGAADGGSRCQQRGNRLAIHLGQKTVRNYVSRLYRKLDLNNRSQNRHILGPQRRHPPRQPD